MNQKENILIGNTPYLYWKCQLVGWSLASLYWAYIFYFKQDYSIFHTITNFIFDVFIGVSLTHVYKLILKKSEQKSFTKSRIIQLTVSILVLAILFMLLNNLKWHIYWNTVKGGNFNLVKSLFFWDPPLITGLRLMTIWVLAYHLYHYYTQQIALTANNAELSILAKQIQLDHLSNQLNPHFLFNSLNSVKSLISENPAKARRSIDLLSDLLRSSIYTKEPLITIEDELQLIYDYIELEKLRFEERLQLKVTVDKTLLGCKIPSLCIQTLIENGLKHGIQDSVKGGTIMLSIEQKLGNIEIRVQNPGQIVIGEIPKNANLGLNNLKKRLYLQYKEKASFTLIEEPKGLVKATIVIPFNTD